MSLQENGGRENAGKGDRVKATTTETLMCGTAAGRPQTFFGSRAPMQSTAAGILWSIATLHPELAGIDRQQLLQVGVGCNSHTAVSNSNRGYSYQPELGGGRDIEASRQGSNQNGPSLSWIVHKQNFPGSQEGWLIQTGGKLETTEPIYGDGSLHDGKLGDDKGPPSEGDWMGSIDLKDAYLLVAVYKAHWKLFLMDGNILRVSEPTIWPVQCSQVFTKFLKPVLAMLCQTGHLIIHVLR